MGGTQDVIRARGAGLCRGGVHRFLPFLSLKGPAPNPHHSHKGCLFILAKPVNHAAQLGLGPIQLAPHQHNLRQQVLVQFGVHNESS